MNNFLDEDVGNIVLLEHVNLQVPDQTLATIFYGRNTLFPFV